MTQSEEARRYALESVNAGDLRATQAAEVLGVSERHVWRLLAAYRSRGAPAMAHCNRGRRPHNALPPALAEAVVRFAAESYPGANHTHLSELLWDHEGLDLSRFTVRRILQQAGMSSPRRRRPLEHRVRRARMPREGMLLQVDGSHHAWLEERGPRFTLLLAVDDATGDVPYAMFRPAEDARGYFSLMKQIVQRRGLPPALYSDRDGVFLSPLPGTARAELASNPYHEWIATGRGSGSALPRTAANGTTNAAAPGRAVNGGAVRPPTARQLARWKANQQAQLQGLSMRVAARLLGLSRVTVSNCVCANGVPGRRSGPAPSLPERIDTDGIAAQLD